MVSPIDIAKRTLSLSTDRVRALPLVILMPHSSCNCRCVMCDIWKANEAGIEISTEEFERHLQSFRRLRVRRVVLSGGEALLHSNLWKLCEQLRSIKIKITLLSSGILLRPHAEQIVKYCDEVIVSLDGSPEVHNRIRNVPRAFEKLAEGVERLLEIKPKLRITGRCVIQKKNYFDLGRIIDTAKQLRLKRISFLAADTGSSAFNHGSDWDGAGDIVLTPEETKHFELVIDNVLRTHKDEIGSGFVAESPEKIRGLVRHYRALNFNDTHPVPICNAPWVSTVIETDGTVRPCFFHAPIGNINEASLEAIVNGEKALSFRENLDMETDPVCRRCVCTLHMRTYRRV